MNLNNKYLAIGLSIAAVLIVFYQVFINKKPAGIRPMVQQETQPLASQPQGTPSQGPQSPQSPFPAHSSSAQPPASGASSGAPLPTAVFSTSSGTETSGNSQTPDHSEDDGMNIDFDSPLLLKRITDAPVEPYPKQELEEEFGGPVFYAPVQQQQEKPLSANETNEIQFRLNAIIIDKTRKLAVVNDGIVQRGDFVSGAEVIEIEKNKVVLRFNDNDIQLSMDTPVQSIIVNGGPGVQ